MNKKKIVVFSRLEDKLLKELVKASVPDADVVMLDKTQYSSGSINLLRFSWRFFTNLACIPQLYRDGLLRPRLFTLYAYIHALKPDLVISMVDNTLLFSMFCSCNAPFRSIAIQNGQRKSFSRSFLVLKKNKVRLRYDIYLAHNKYIYDLFNRNAVDCNKLKVTGSLREIVSREATLDVKSSNSNAHTETECFRILWVSNYRLQKQINGSRDQQLVASSLEKLIKELQDACNHKGIGFSSSVLLASQCDEETIYYRHIYEDFSFIPQSQALYKHALLGEHRFSSSYSINFDVYSLIIGYTSTLLDELDSQGILTFRLRINDENGTEYFVNSDLKARFVDADKPDLYKHLVDIDSFADRRHYQCENTDSKSAEKPSLSAFLDAIRRSCQ